MPAEETRRKQPIDLYGSAHAYMRPTELSVFCKPWVFLIATFLILCFDDAVDTVWLGLGSKTFGQS